MTLKQIATIFCLSFAIALLMGCVSTGGYIQTDYSTSISSSHTSIQSHSSNSSSVHSKVSVQSR